MLHVTDHVTINLTNGGPRMRYFIAGGGEYGSHYVRKLRIALAKGTVALEEIVVVDRDPNCLAIKEIDKIPIGRLYVSDWAAFGEEVWSHRQAWADDVWVPAPIAPHILAGWIVERIRREFGLDANPVRDAMPLPKIPYAKSLPDGRVLLSHAPGLCPLGCIEPGECAITKNVRWWEMRQTIDEIVAKSMNPPIDEVAMFFCKHHCDAGEYDVGGIRMKTIYEEGDRVCDIAKSGRGRIGVATFSSCHGVLNVFDLQASLVRTQKCVQCGSEFRCGAEAGKDHCWCAELAHVMPVRGTGGCYCPECLKLEIGLRLRGTGLVTLQEA